LVVGGQKVSYQAQCSSFGAFFIFPVLVTTQLFPVSASKNCSERATINELWGNHCKSDKIADGGIKKLFPECPRSFTNIDKNMSLPKETTLKAVNQFREFLEASSKSNIRAN
jgi:hypothetical protein